VQALVPLFVEPGEATLVACWEALGMVTGSIPKDLLPSYVPVLKEAIATAREKVGLVAPWSSPPDCQPLPCTCADRHASLTAFLNYDVIAQHSYC
jgi:hypothetical protein